jgi:hypothetical protein
MGWTVDEWMNWRVYKQPGHKNVLRRECRVKVWAGIATRYELDGPGIESRWGRDFQHPSIPALGPTQPPVQWVPSFPGVKRLGRGVDHPTLSSAEVKERVELYPSSPSGPSWPVLGWILPLPLCTGKVVGGVVIRIRNLGTRWRWVVSFTLQTLCYGRRGPLYLLDKRLGETQCHVWILFCRESWNASSSVIQRVT